VALAFREEEHCPFCLQHVENRVESIGIPGRVEYNATV